MDRRPRQIQRSGEHASAPRVHPWVEVLSRVKPLFFDAPAIRPLIRDAPTAGDAFRLTADVAELRVTYKPTWRAEPVSVAIAERTWWEPRLATGEDHAFRLAHRLAAELREAWERGRSG